MAEWPGEWKEEKIDKKADFKGAKLKKSWSIDGYFFRITEYDFCDPED